MKLQTQIPKSDLRIDLDHLSKIFLSGSCFADNIGYKLLSNKFNALVNPLGICYNPLSLFNLLQRSLLEDRFSEEDYDLNEDLHFCYDLHSDFSSLDLSKAVKKANKQLELQKAYLEGADCIILSLGTAWVHVRKSTRQLVNNCHKIPAAQFEKRLLSVTEIVEAWKDLSEHIGQKQKIILTISPVRHLKDGFHENQLSKAILLLAVEEICSEYKNCNYFPSYEIMMDELRDYRFYDQDLVHPSSMAIGIIWEYFVEMCLSKNGQKDLQRIQSLMNSFHHKAFEPQSSSHQKFLKKLITDFESAQAEIKIDLSEEINELRHRTNLSPS